MSWTKITFAAGCVAVVASIPIWGYEPQPDPATADAVFLQPLHSLVEALEFQVYRAQSSSVGPLAGFHRRSPFVELRQQPGFDRFQQLPVFPEVLKHPAPLFVA